MILADSSVWIDHFRRPIPRLQALSTSGQICCHPFITGELVAGSIHVRHPAIALLRSLTQLKIADEQAFYDFVESNRLNGLGLGFVDLHLLRAVASTPGHKLWSNDARLANQAMKLNIAYQGD